MAKVRARESVVAYRIGFGIFLLFIVTFLALYVGFPSLGKTTYQKDSSAAPVVVE